MLFADAKQSVEIFHLIFLNQLGRRLDKKLYALKGGCNMRFFFNSMRYSEDMDIDVRVIAKDTLRNKVNQILNALPFHHILQAKNLEIIDINQPKQTETTQRWKILLKNRDIGMPLHTKIEFSRRSVDGEIIFEAINTTLLRRYSLLPIMANHYSATSMFSQKILALALRSQIQARDVFDLYYLIQLGVRLKHPDKNISNHLHQAQENAMGISFSDFKGQVLAFLEPDYFKEYDNKKIWNDMVSAVVNSLSLPS